MRSRSLRAGALASALLVFAAISLAGICLLRRAQKDANAFADFYDVYAERVLIFFTRRTLEGELAIDLMSETFAKALANRHQFRGRTAAEEQAWLFAIARNELWQFRRRGRVEQEALKRVGFEVPPITDADLERIEDLAGIRAIASPLQAAMDSLPQDQQHAVRLRIIDDLGYAEVAAAMRVTQQVARARVSRGLRTLAGVLEAQGIYAEDVA